MEICDSTKFYLLLTFGMGHFAVLTLTAYNPWGGVAVTVFMLIELRRSLPGLGC
ncbi:hypothetical protein LY78DRAFT_656907 [Colletotrichum sublineola]|nr:hypothetical protein LY78DRAFT_656907 [Colletotrichum sublineola]